MSALDDLVETINLPNVDFDGWASPEDVARVKSAADYQQDVIDAVLNPQTFTGLTLPWAKTHRIIRLRAGEISLWAGVNSHGKSLLLQQVMQHAAYHDEVSCIASLEMKPVKTMQRSLRQAIGVEQPSLLFMKRYFKWIKHRMWVYDQTGTVTPKRMLGVARYSAVEKGCHHVVVDSLLKCGIAEDDYNGQKKFVDELACLARDTNTHIHLVAHMRKGDETKLTTKFDVRGSGAISDLVDNVFVVWRNKEKEVEARKPNPSQEIMKKPDAMLLCDKQRHAEGDVGEGCFGLWLHTKSQQFVEKPGQRMELLGQSLEEMSDES